MSPQMISAIRKEAFVQGWIRSRAAVLGRALSEVDDETILSWLPAADEAHALYRSERSANAGGT